MHKHALFINLSNHPSSNWSEDQMIATLQYGEVIDIPFPDISPLWDRENISNLADEYILRIMTFRDKGITVHVMGEMTFTYAVVSRLKKLGIVCVASTTERRVVERDGKKISEFRFVRFRQY